MMSQPPDIAHPDQQPQSPSPSREKEGGGEEEELPHHLGFEEEQFPQRDKIFRLNWFLDRNPPIYRDGLEIYLPKRGQIFKDPKLDASEPFVDVGVILTTYPNTRRRKNGNLTSFFASLGRIKSRRMLYFY